MLIGDERVGKTSLVKKYVDNTFTEEYKRTLGFELSEAAVTTQTGVDMILSIWDIGRRPRGSKSLLKQYFEGARGMFLVFDQTRADTFDHCAHWLKYARKRVPGAPVIVVENKRDLPEREVPQEKIDDFCARNRVDAAIRTSAKTGTDVPAMFRAMADLLIAKG